MALNDKQALFVEEYLKTFNATQAAIAAGYSQKTAYNIGYENVRKREIAEAISQRLTEAAMSADEVLKRLAEQARGDVDDYLDEDGFLDWKKARRGKKTGLVRKLKIKKTTRIIDDAEYITVETDFELYDAQAALVHIGKHHGMFVDRTEHTGADGGKIKHEIEYGPNAGKSIVDVVDRLALQIAGRASAGTTNGTE